MLISIIMPFYNHLDLIHNRLNEFYRFLPVEDIEILLIDDGSTESGIDGIVAFWQKQIAKHKIRYFKNGENLGFGASMNKGAEKATGDILVFFSDDVVVNSNFLPEISYRIGEDDKVLVGGELMDFDTGWNNFNGRVITYLNGWLLACTKKAWEMLGGFDPRYGISDVEDIDLCMTASQMGFRLEPLTQNKLRHLGGQTAGYNPEREKRTRINLQKFRDKWGF